MWFFKLFIKNVFVVNKKIKKFLSTKTVDKWGSKNRNSRNYIGLILSYFLLTWNVYASDLGKIAHTFPIKEIDPIEVIIAQLKARSPKEIQQHQQNIVKKVKKMVMRPTANELPRVVESRAFIFDPSIRVSRDILDPIHKNVLIPKGTVVEPLSQVTVSNSLIFVNSDDIEQLEWVKKQKGLIVLTKGTPIKLSEQINRRIYFDQFGVLIKKFGIAGVPARVSQFGKKLLVEELAV